MKQDTVTDPPSDSNTETTTTATPLTEFDAWVQARYAETVDAAGDDGIDRLDAVIAITKKAQTMIESGKLRLPIDVTARLINDSTRSVDNREGRKTLDRITEVSSVVAGDALLNEDDPLLSAVARIGSGRRKTWRHVGADDITHMIVMKARHAQDAATASAEFAVQAAAVLKALRTKGQDATVGDVL